MRCWTFLAEQRCRNHKIVNVLDKLPKKLQAEASEMLTKIPYGASANLAAMVQ